LPITHNDKRKSILLYYSQPEIAWIAKDLNCQHTLFLWPNDAWLERWLCKLHINWCQVLGNLIVIGCILNNLVHSMSKTCSVKGLKQI
jgi:hypothetical protein